MRVYIEKIGFADFDESVLKKCKDRKIVKFFGNW